MMYDEVSTCSLDVWRELWVTSAPAKPVRNLEQMVRGSQVVLLAKMCFRHSKRSSLLGGSRCSTKKYAGPEDALWKRETRNIRKTQEADLDTLNTSSNKHLQRVLPSYNLPFFVHMNWHEHCYLLHAFELVLSCFINCCLLRTNYIYLFFVYP